ncbi:MAG: UDP-N-acetylmuramate--L-alanine ligase [Actinomycetota bacterium]|nr:UDP-N-acetylmuramate--L-alanine ligase [Actinomycetota bacterium]
MSQIDLEQLSHVHIVGVGGAGMSAIAIILSERQIHVSGSDLKASSAFERLRGYGVDLHVGHRSENIDGADLVLISSAIRPSNVEVVAALENSIPVIDRRAFFPTLMQGKRPLAVAGTHGKTTTTSMLALALIKAGLEPSYIIGGELNETGTSAAYGDGDYFVVEADESDKSFLGLGAYGVIVTNIEPDHLENYRDYSDQRDHFYQFVKAAPGPKVLGRYLGDAVEVDSETAVTFSATPGTDYVAQVTSVDDGNLTYSITAPDGTFVESTLMIPGRHNVMNAAAAIAMAHQIGVPMETSASAISSFLGVARRYQLKGDFNGALVVDDYAHLPSEIDATLEATRSRYPGRRVVAVFQPHRFSRTQRLASDFAKSLSAADVVVVADVYAAGEVSIPGVSGELIAVELNGKYPLIDVMYHPSRSDLADVVAPLIEEGDVVLTLGAGDITSLYNEIVSIESSGGFRG